jgi:predicted CoA-binding protein
MPTMRETSAEFLSQNRVAVTGVSRTPANHGSNVVYKRLRERGYDVYAVNPNADSVEGDRSFHDLNSIPVRVDWVVAGTRPERVLPTVQECERLGIKRVWMHRAFGEGSVSEDATTYGREHGMTIIDGGCPCMFDPTADAGHKVMRAMCTLTHKVPRHIELAR